MTNCLNRVNYYAVRHFSDIHANLEALEAVLAKIDELAQEEPIEQICLEIWSVMDLTQMSAYLNCANERM